MPARWLAALLVLAAAAPADAGERYFVVLFGSQSVPKVAKLTHTFATAVKVTDDALAPAGAGSGGSVTRDPGGVSVDAKTISFLPAALDIKVLRLRPEPGVNLSLGDTLKFVASTNQRAAVWGPYEVDAARYGNLARQYDKVVGGFYQYQAVDSVNPDPRVTDCIHAVTDADPSYGRNHYPLSRFGESATHHIARQFFQRNLVIDPAADHGWLLDRLGVTADAADRQELVTVPGGPGVDPGWRVRRVVTRRGR